MQAQRIGPLAVKVEIVEGTMHEGTIRERVIGSEKARPPQANAASRRQVIIGAAGVFGGLSVTSVSAWASATEEISHTAEAIHQEVVFKASRKRVYEALTDAKQFNKVVLLSAAMQSGGMAPGSKPAEVSPEVGGAFSAFGGYVSGRHIEFVPNERIVQAWRAASWGPGQYSIAKFELTEQGSGTKLVFDHAGFPQGQGAHLAEGWKTNYWEPLQKYFAQG
jgi:uncharacterized protein YndB with AHSA1/START domain